MSQKQQKVNKNTQPNKKKNPNKKGKINKQQKFKRANKLYIKGSGDYSLSSMGESIGGRLGSLAGRSLGGLISSVTGFGDYTVKSNTLMTSTPDFSNSAFVRISQKEFIGDVSGKIAFTTAISRVLNPSNKQLFPWLSSWSKVFEDFTFNGLIFHYKPTSGTAVGSTSTAIGYVTMATQYNPYDASFKNKQDMENYQYSTSGVSFEAQLHPVECDRSLTKQPILSIKEDVSGDRRFSSMGIFNLAVGGAQVDNAVIGELWVTYDITLYKKASRPISQTDHFRGDTGVTTLLPLGVTITAGTGNNLGCSVSGNVVTLPTTYYGQIHLIYSYVATVDVAHPLVVTLSSSIVAANYLEGDTASTQSVASATKYIFQAMYTVVGGGTLTLTLPSSTSSGFTSCELIIGEVTFEN